MTKYQKCGKCGARIKVVRIATGRDDGPGLPAFQWEILDDDGSSMPHVCENQPAIFTVQEEDFLF